MRFLGNIIWVVFGGFFWALSLLVVGIFWCITVVGIPVGVQCFQFASFVLWPFGKKVESVSPNGLKAILNFVWAVLFGWIMALGYLLTGLLFCITVIGLPFGRQYFKMAHFVLMPLGRTFVKVK